MLYLLFKKNISFAKKYLMKPLLKIIFVLLLFAVNYSGCAQTSLTSPSKYFLFKNYSTQNGLINNTIYALAQDRHGYIWCGSDFGLSRFDGKTFYHKAIPEIYNNSAQVRYIETTKKGNLITTSLMQGVFVQQDDGKFKRYLQKGYVELGKNVFNSVKYCPNGRILASVSTALFSITNDTLQRLYTSNNTGVTFFTLEMDNEHRIWFGGRLGFGILQQTGDEYEALFLPELKGKFIVKILFDDEGTLHIGTSQGYYQMKWHDPARWDSNYTIEQPFPELKDSFINHIYRDKEQNIWLSTSSYGVFRTKENRITLHLTHENGLLSSSILCMLQDKEGNYWFGTDAGISMIDHFENFAMSKNGVRFNEAEWIIKDSYNRIWIHNGNKLHLLQDDKLIPLDLQGTPFEKVEIGKINIYHSELIISNPTGIYKMPITQSLPDLRKIIKIVDYSSYNVMNVRKLVTDSLGIWVCAEKQIFNYHNGKFLPVTFLHPDSLSLRPMKIMQDKYGYYWYGDYTFGLYRGTISKPDKNTLLFDNITAFKSRDADSAFVTLWIQDMVFDKEDNLWFLTLYTGAYQLAINNSGVVSYKLYSTANGLLSNRLEKIECDEDGRIWIMSDKGINIIQRDGIGVETVHTFDVNEGIVGTGLMPLPIGERLYLLTEEGLFITQNQLFKEKFKKVPNVFITNLFINGIRHQDFTTNLDIIHLAHTQNNITIEFSSITFRNANSIKYQYYLEGTKSKWSELSERGFVEYASLRPGKYTFKVRATIGEVAGEETTLAFRIAPAFYQTIWFYLIIVILVFALLYTSKKKSHGKRA